MKKTTYNHPGTEPQQEQGAFHFQSKTVERVQEMIARHAGRTVLYYELHTQLIRVCGPDGRAGDPKVQKDLFEWDALSERSQKRVERMMRSISAGKAYGEMNLRIKRPVDHWLNLKYSTMLDGDGSPVAAIVSYQDITEHHRHEMAYLRQRQALEEESHLGLLEADITADIVEEESGRLMEPGAKSVGKSLADFTRYLVERGLMEFDQAEKVNLFSPDYLLEQYRQGHQVLGHEWPMSFPDGGEGWVRMEVDLILDPYTNHVKGFFKATDITMAKETLLLAQKRSDQDGMTGLLNRAALERQVSACLREDERPGVMLLVDMDDLKKVNDVYGHGEGDRVIREMAQALRSHFRESDVVGRLGGDEFLVYLRGAGENLQAIAASLTALSRRLGAILVGDENKRGIRCSIGCAVPDAGAAGFEALYRRADVALYHVKRGTKNGFAFYEPAMEEQDYQFKAEKQLQTLRDAERGGVPGQEQLLETMLGIFDLVMSVNLTANRYYRVAETKDGVFQLLSPDGTLEDFMELAIKGVHPEDAGVLREMLSRDTLIREFQQGRRSARAKFRFKNGSVYCCVECSVILYVNDAGDVCDFALLRWMNDTHKSNG